MIRWLIGIILTLTFWGFVWINIEHPATLSFDEHHYIPAAKSYLSGGPMTNIEHPPLGKILIAQGLKVAGDNPKGWRLMSSFFGALTLSGIYLWALVLFGSIRMAVYTSVLTVSNGMLYVQSRIAMLDTFMTAWLVAAGCSFSFWLKHKNKSWSLLLAALFFGLATGTKWFTLIPLAVTGITLLYLALKKHVSWRMVFCFSWISFFTYMFCYLPMAWNNPAIEFSLSNFFDWQLDMYDAQQRVPAIHPYGSSWWSWPLLLRPIWYAYDAIPGTDLVRGVVLLGNPFLLWSGLVALLYCAYLAWKKRCPVATQIAIAYVICLLGYFFIPRKMMFFYYYYPAALMLSFAVARSFQELAGYLKCYYEDVRWTYAALSLGFFWYFLPILSAVPIKAIDLWNWTWLKGWV